MANYNFESWCLKAIAQIRFAPDRDAVMKELYAHMEDHCDALLAQGLSREDAERQTLVAMGSAEEIAPQLAEIHHPFWGYFLRATRIMLVILACCAVLCGIPFAFNTIYSQPQYYRYDPYADTYISDEVGITTRLFYTEPNQVAQSDGYTLTLTRAAWHHTDFAGEELPRDLDSFCFQIEVFNPRPWAGPPEFKQWFWAEDSLGNHYYSMWENANSAESWISGNYYHCAPLTYTLDMWVTNFRSQEAQWIDIHYDRAGRNIVFRIDLTGGVTA